MSWLIPTLVIVLAAGAGGAAVLRSGSEPKRVAGQVVSEFFQAQRDGDCERLIDLLTTASWSDHGKRSRRDFLDQCSAALDGYTPSIDEVDVETVNDDGDPDENGDRVMVRPSPRLAAGQGVSYGDEPDERPSGRLEREDGEWKVQIDEIVMRIGRSPDEAVRGYLEAYNDGDCEGLLRYLTDPARSAHGDLTRDEFLDYCDSAVANREGLTQRRRLEAPSLELAVDGSTAKATVRFTLGGAEIRGPTGEPEVVRLVHEDLRWRIDGSEAVADDASPGTPLQAIRYAELEAALVDELTLDDIRCFNYSDDVVAEDGAAAPELQIARGFSSCYAIVSVLQFSNDDDARRAAEDMASEVVAEPLPTAEELASSSAEHELATDLDLSDWQESVATRRPNAAVEVPGVPEAFGVQTWCSVDGCSEAVAYLPHGNLVVKVEMESGDINDVAVILPAQRERL